MKTSLKSIFKIIIVFIATFFFTNIAKGQKDTAIYFFKFVEYITKDGYVPVMVNSLATADYFRLILPPDHGDDKPNVEEFYKSGKIKLIGKLAPKDTNYTKINMNLDGDCATFYPSGKKESFTTYTDGLKNGNEYLYYPDGKIYCYLTNQLIANNFVKEYWKECYDRNGNEICEAGNGQWILYDLKYEKIIMRGQVKKSLQQGKWAGDTFRPDSIKYTFLYDDGELMKCTGYDKNGTAYDFDKVLEKAYYKGGPPAFIQSIRNHLNWPKDNNDKNLLIQCMYLS